MSRPRSQVNILFDEHQRLTAENTVLRHALEVILRGATCTHGQDSGGWDYAHVRQAMLNTGREALGLPTVEDRSCVADR